MSTKNGGKIIFFSEANDLLVGPGGANDRVGETPGHRVHPIDPSNSRCGVLMSAALVLSAKDDAILGIVPCVVHFEYLGE